MSDTTHNTLVTLMIIIAIFVAIILIGRGFDRMAFYGYRYQPANALSALESSYYEHPPIYTHSVTSYSRPSHRTDFGMTSYTSTKYDYETAYTFTCSPDDYYCLTGY